MKHKSMRKIRQIPSIYLLKMERKH
uniref:Uncharacterized protein n=1 Tax=Rhizophora mucronata TaxID=61149 RepID=A0A2P2QRY4_RHIMU